jgi:hypothetical protein
MRSLFVPYTRKWPPQPWTTIFVTHCYTTSPWRGTGRESRKYLGFRFFVSLSSGSEMERDAPRPTSRLGSGGLAGTGPISARRDHPSATRVARSGTHTSRDSGGLIRGG